MVGTISSTFSSHLLTSEREMADERINQLVRRGSVVVSLYYVSQLYLGSGSIQTITHLSALITLLSAAISYFLANKFDKNWLILGTYIPILLIPIYLEPYIEKGWISYGLVIAIFVFTAALMNSVVLASTLVILGVVWHYIVANLNLISVIDNQDILLLNSYFSSSWLLISGFGIIIFRIVYFRICDQIDIQLFGIEDELQEEAKSISQMNLRDHRSIVIHGTVLNTLISYSRLLDKPDTQVALADQLSEDLAKIESIEFANRNPISIQELLETNLSSYGVKLTFDLPKNLQLEKDTIENLLELIREIVLNTRKHSNSKNISVRISQVEGFLNLNIVESFEKRVTVNEANAKIKGARASLTLDRLIKSASAQISFEIPATYERLIYKIEIPIHINRFKILKNITLLRTRSLTKNIEALSTVSLAYTFLALAGFIYLNVPTYINIALFVIAILMGLELKLTRKTQWRPILLQSIALSLIPMTLIGEEQCKNLLFTPWLFNAIFGAVLYATFSIKNPILKWTPGIIFVLESFSTRFLYPQECLTLFDGSTPGFIFILIFSFVLGRARNRNLALDANLEKSLRVQTESTIQASTQIDIKRTELVDELEKYAEKLRSKDYEKDLLIQDIDIWIQKLRAFLICSEHYKSDFVRQIYDFMQSRLKLNRKTRISIYTGDLADKYDFDLDLLKKLDEQSKDSEVELILTESDKLALEYYADSDLIGTLYITN
jgi:hypothetical protein